MKRIGFGAILLLLALSVSPSTWEGSAVVGGLGDFPAEGLFGACNSFPRDSLVELKNLENGKTVKIRISGGVDNPGVFIALSPKAAQELGMKAGAAARVRAFVLPQSSAPLALPIPPASGESSDPDYNPRLLAARGRSAAASGPAGGELPSPAPTETSALAAPVEAPLVQIEPSPPDEPLPSPPLETELAEASELPEAQPIREPALESPPSLEAETAALVGGELPLLPEPESPEASIEELPNAEVRPEELAEAAPAAEIAAPGPEPEESPLVLGGETPPLLDESPLPELALADAEIPLEEGPAELDAAGQPTAEEPAPEPLPELAELSTEVPPLSEPIAVEAPELAEALPPAIPEPEAAVLLGGDSPLPEEAAPPEAELAEAEVLPESQTAAEVAASLPDAGAVEEIPETEEVPVLEATAARPPSAPSEGGSPGLPPALSPAPATASAARATPALLERLAPGSYYVQVAVFGNDEALGKAASGLGPLPLAAERIEGKSGSLYRLYVGPLGRDEGGALLIKIRSLGFKDAFIKRGG